VFHRNCDEYMPQMISMHLYYLLFNYVYMQICVDAKVKIKTRRKI